MANAIHLDPNQVPGFLRTALDYAGRTFTAEVCESVSIPADAGLWSGGSRDMFAAFNLTTGESMALPGQDLFIEGRKAYTAPLQPGLVIVRRSYFCGRDAGLAFFVHPSNAALMLPAPPAADLFEHEQRVIGLISSLIPKARREYAARAGIDAATYDSIVAKLKERGLVSGNGGLTTKGKNVAATLPREFCQ